MKTNVKVQVEPVVTHEGGRAERQTAFVELVRAVSTCLLFEDTFYESGSEIAKRMAALCKKVTPAQIGALAVMTRNQLKLRHVPLWLAIQLVRREAEMGTSFRISRYVINDIVQRPDEMAELMAIYWKDGRKPLPAQMKRGLAMSFNKFSEYQLAKWNRDNAVKLRDVLFLVHAKPKDKAQEALWKKLVDGSLEAADTWEVALSSGKDKKATWERLIRDEKLGFMALLMNLRNMTEANVEKELVEKALILGAKGSKALPFRFISAAKHAPRYADALNMAMLSAVEGHLDGTTYLVVDISGSMDVEISKRSTLLRWEAAGALAILLRQICDDCRVFTFTDSVKEVQNIRGLPLVTAIGNSQVHGSTYLGRALESIKTKCPAPDRLIVITDEQAHDRIIHPWCEKAYLVNVAPYKPGLDTSGGWTRISGWSERLVDWIRFEEAGYPDVPMEYVVRKPEVMQAAKPPAPEKRVKVRKETAPKAKAGGNGKPATKVKAATRKKAIRKTSTKK